MSKSKAPAPVNPADIVYSPQDIAAIGTSYLEHRRSIAAEGHLGLKLGLDKVDQPNGVFMPAMPGDLITIIGRPGCGKTSMMMRWARWRARQLCQEERNDRVVVYITYEQHIEELNAFHVAAEEGISVTDMAMGRITDDEWGKVEAAGVRRATSPLWFIGHSMERRKKRPIITIGAIATALETIESWRPDQKFIIDSVFIDYLQRIPYEKEPESKTIGMDENLNRLKDGALAFACPFIVGVQARRDVDDRRLPVPQMDDGQWTSGIEQVSDKIFSLVRPRKYRQEGESFGSITVHGHTQMLVSVLKQKLGKDNVAYWLEFDPAYNRFDQAETEAQPEEEPDDYSDWITEH